MMSFTKSIVVSALLLTGAALAAPASAGTIAVGEEHCVVNVRADDPLTIRKGPGAGTRAVGSRDYGSCGIYVTGSCQGNWCPVEDGHVSGWVNRRYISMVSPSRYCVTGVAKGDRLNMRAYPSPKSRIVTRLARNACGIAFLPYSTGGWQKVRSKGWQGWVNARFLSGE